MIKTEALLEKLFENTKSILLVTDEKFIIRYVSSSVESTFGLQAYSAVGRNAFDFVNEDNRDNWRACLEAANGNMSTEVSFLTPAGHELHFEATVTNHIANSEIRGLVVIMYDITEKKQRNRVLVNANNQLDQFIFKTVHDLRAPIHSALGLIELTTKSNPEEKEKYFDLIRARLIKMDSFIDEVSSYYKNEKLGIVKEKIDFNEIFRAEKESIQNLPGADKIHFDYEFSGSASLVSDPMRLKTILTNVLSNSIKYSDPYKVSPFVKVNVQICERACKITIEDNGLGIKEEHLDKIFDIFFRSHVDIAGTGLGLYIVKDTVTRLGGEIEVSSEFGKGTTFQITIPNLSESQLAHTSVEETSLSSSDAFCYRSTRQDHPAAVDSAADRLFGAIAD